MVDFPGVTTADGADIVDRVFEMKIHEFMKYLQDVKPFGESKRSQEDIDNYISAELLSQHLDPEGRRIVLEFMIHDPCGDVCPAAACIKNTSTGTGKTFLWKTIIYALRAQGKIVLAVASSGIASLLLPSGRTSHLRVKLPLDLSDTSMCSVTKNTQLALLLKETDLIK
nr:DNA helicase [Tanacetum cinerariifolium]